ncbi:coatomer subunit alpha [Quaeritorhiza haematococci]|nr:coatomer subunit alpha [Quaeritorhiza haematococci]
MAPDTVPRYPIREISCRAKISCLSWNPYIKSQLASTDYEGVVTLWDASVGVGLAQFDEHEKRAWSVDFSKVDPMRLASGSDDSKVKIWSTNQRNSAITIESKANVCSVRFNPVVNHQIAFGSADHHIHYYDLRNPMQPLYVFRGHRKAVSYVKFVSKDEVVSASTDCTLRLWSLSKLLNQESGSSTNGGGGGVEGGAMKGYDSGRMYPPVLGQGTRGGGSSSGGYTYTFGGTLQPINRFHPSTNSAAVTITSRTSGGSSGGSSSGSNSQQQVVDPHCVRTYTGHTNEKNFVGLSGEEVPDEDPSQFVSSVCWKNKTPNVLVAANSQGRIKVMEMV